MSKRKNTERMTNSLPMSTKELHSPEDLSLPGIKLFFQGIVIFYNFGHKDTNYKELANNNFERTRRPFMIVVTDNLNHETTKSKNDNNPSIFLEQDIE